MGGSGLVETCEVLWGQPELSWVDAFLGEEFVDSLGVSNAPGQQHSGDDGHGDRVLVGLDEVPALTSGRLQSVVHGLAFRFGGFSFII